MMIKYLQNLTEIFQVIKAEMLELQSFSAFAFLIGVI